MKRTLEKLRERPHHEKHQIARLGAIITVVVLFMGWAGISMHSVYANASATSNAAAAAAPNAVYAHGVSQ